MGLETYRKKRNFAKTPEPAGERPESSSRDGFFVVQKHDASRLHYDFRLAIGGVLKSWAVPKGFPTEKGDRRLAVEVEDHPMDYAGFEGTIAPGNYGAGTVMVWDRGDFTVLDGPPQRAWEKGKLHLKLSGKKLKGEWTLVRMKSRGESHNNWLMLKSGANTRAISAKQDNTSVQSGRSMAQISGDQDAQWISNRSGSKTKPKKSKETAADAGENLPKSDAAWVEPMKALLVSRLPKGKKWAYEIKFDGIRALAVKDGSRVELWSRNHKPLGGRFAAVPEAVGGLDAASVVLDGEIVAVDPEGRPSFQLLQTYQMPGQIKPPLFYYIFDLLHLDGRSLMGLPLKERRAQLEPLLKDASGLLRYSGAIEANSAEVMAAMKERGLEGVIAKDSESTYEPGRRSGAWAKFKWTQEQEFVIGGFTPPEGARSHFGALLVGYYEGSRLKFASKVGTGFDEAVLKSLHQALMKRRRENCPFTNLPEQNRQGLTKAEMARCTWVEPESVCQVRFSEWTRDGHLRHPVFLGLRDDKEPAEVHREVPQKKR